MNDQLLHRFESFIKDNQLFSKKDYLLLACSAGVDSSVLGYLLKAAGYSFEIAHCNFQLRGADSTGDEILAKELGKLWNVPVHVQHFETLDFASEHKLSVQMAARQLRYDWFNQLLKASAVQPAYLLTAHHADDSVETVLMNMFKETGIKGMHGILPKQNNIIRPLLFARKTEILAFAKANKLPWREDISNASDKYTRNFFRLHVLPLVEKAIPNAVDNFLTTIDHLKEAEHVYNDAVMLLKKKLVKQVGKEFHIPVAKLKTEKNVASISYEIIQSFGFNNQQLADFLQLLDADTGKYIASKDWRIIKNRKWLIIAPLAEKTASVIVIENDDRSVFFEQEKLSIKYADDLIAGSNKGEAFLDASMVKFPLILRKWKPGDYFYPLGMTKKKKINRFLIDQKLSPTEKENIWVMESHKKIIWVVGYRIDDRFKITGKTKKVINIKKG